MNTSKAKLSIFWLTILFAAPGILAYFFYTHSYLLPEHTTNHGQFIQPPLLLTEKSENKKWRIIYWQKDEREANYYAMLDKLARIRIFLGRKFYQTELVFLTTIKFTQQMIDVFKEQDIIVSNNLTNNDIELLGSSPMIFLQNSTGYLILQYPILMREKDLLQDIKHLLGKEE